MKSEDTLNKASNVLSDACPTSVFEKVAVAAVWLLLSVVLLAKESQPDS